LVELQQLVQDYSKYLNFPQINEQKVNIINETIEQMLAQLDELNALVETVKLNSETTKSLLPSLVEQTKRLDKSFEVIYGLIDFVSLLDASVTQFDDRLTEAEQASSEAISQRAKHLLGSFKGLKTSDSTIAPPEVKSDKDIIEPVKPPVSILNSQEYFTNFKSKLNKK